VPRDLDDGSALSVVESVAGGQREACNLRVPDVVGLDGSDRPLEFDSVEIFHTIDF